METNNINVQPLGIIKLSKTVYVTDPCYTPDIWCNAFLYTLAAGTYKCFIKTMDCGDWGNTIAELHVVKESMYNKYKDLDKIPYNKNKNSCVIGVDSGQCGIFDAEYYEAHFPDDDVFVEDTWYNMVCQITNEHPYAGTIDNLGVVVSSGYGDGCYDLYTARTSRGISAMKVVFIYSQT